MPLAVPILTYHAAVISGNDYANNDHVAFAADLRALRAHGWTVAGLDRIVAALQGAATLPSDKVVGLSFDDGTDFDFLDLVHPRWGVQRSMFGVLQDFLREHPHEQPHLHATSFVVVSPQARTELDASCLVGRGWWSDGWWTSAIASGRWSIASHSWDHNHLGVAQSVAKTDARGTFRNITDFAAAEAEIAQATAHLKTFAANAGDALFAYPYGESNDYLVRDYLPRHAQRIGLVAAFGSDPGPATPASDRWQLPRFVFGHHWNSPEGLARLLRDVAR